MLVTFGLPVSVQFQANPYFFAKFPGFYVDIFPLSSFVVVMYVVGSPYIASIQGHGESARNTQTTGRWERPCRWQKILLGYARKIILAHNLLRQASVRSRVPVWILVQQGSEEAIFTDRSGVRPCDRD